MPAPKCFLSYAHEGINRETLDYLIQSLKDSLGSEALLYDGHLRYGARFSEFMAHLNTVDAVLLILTPQYKRKLNERDGGVYTEFTQLWHRYMNGSAPQPGETISRFEIIPILFSGSAADAIPDEIGDFNYLDLTGLRVTRKPTGEFVVPLRTQAAFTPRLAKLVSQIRGIATVGGSNFQHLYQTYYDRLFVDLKARFDDPIFAAQDYLNTIVVKTRAYRRLMVQNVFFVVGRKGSGKSTLTQVLPFMNPDRYYGLVNIVVDDFNLESLFGLYSDQQFRSDINAVVSRDRAFEYTWEALLMLAVIERVLATENDLNLPETTRRLLIPMKRFLTEVMGTASDGAGERWTTTDFFNYAFNATVNFVKHCIDSARADEAVFLVDIGAKFTRESYLRFVFPEQCLFAFRALLPAIKRQFLITLDGFDTAYDRFRLDTIRNRNADDLKRRSHFEIDWLRSLLRLVVKAKAATADDFYKLLDFCIAVPKDRFLEIQRVERDSYRNWHRGAPLNWSGIELAILLRKRLEVLADYTTHKTRSPELRLSEVLAQDPLKALPTSIQFDYNGRSYKMDLFLYVLRHTFWRPREVLVYYAALLALAKDTQRWEDNVSTEAARLCIKATTRKVIESEFIAEFRTSVVNIEEIISAFRKCKPLFPYEEMSRIVKGVSFRFASGVADPDDALGKARFLYEIGFVGVRANRELMDQSGLKLRDAFHFNEGDRIWQGVDEADVASWEFLIHPVFSEYLHLDCGGQELSLPYTWEYLRFGDTFMAANPEF